MGEGGGRRIVVPLGIAVLTALAGALAVAIGARDSVEVAEPQIPWPLLAVLFGLAELVVLHIQVRREARTLSLSEIPLVLGLLLTPPIDFVLARLLGPLVVFVAWRRQAAFKVLFNVAMQAAAVLAAVLVHDVVRGDQQFPELLALVALIAAVLVAALVETLALDIVVGLYEHRLRARQVLRDALRYPTWSLGAAIFGIVAAYALQRDPWSAVFLVACAGVLVALFRTVAALQERHSGLEGLYHLSQTVTATSDPDAVLRVVLEEVQEVTKASVVEIYLAEDDRGRAFRRVRLDDRGGVSTVVLCADQVPPIVIETVVEGALPLLLRRGEREPARRAVLEAWGHRDAVFVPLRGDTGVLGILAVADRAGEVRGFDRSDQLLLETAAAHTSVVLQSGRLVEQLVHETLHDRLTGLPNRASFKRSVEEALEAAAASDRRTRTAVMIMDVDGFKDVNDDLGHHEGDAVLKLLASRLATAAAAVATVARIGGDEFAALVPHAFDDEIVRGIARGLLASLEQTVPVGRLEIALSASLGIAVAPDHGNTVNDLLKRADVAMYAAKSAASGIAMYEPLRHEKRSPRRLTLVGDLRRALEAGELDLHVQAKASLLTGAIEGVEALSRFRGPRLGAVAPEEFIPVAERSGLIGELTRRVLDAGLGAVRHWLVDGRTISLAVNLSPRSLLDPELVPSVDAALRRHGVPPSLLTLEITESSVMAEPARAIGALHALRGLGLRLSLDDFGTGYSSLSYLKRLPVNEVKIDKSFVLTMDRDADNASIVRAIVDLGANLGLRVVAEGVETLEVWCRLRELGCDVAQGYLLNRPMPISAVPSWLASYDLGGAKPSAGTPRRSAHGSRAGGI